MDNQSSVIQSKDVNGVTARVIPGHFATNHSHINSYVDLTDVKTQHKMARQAAAALARRYVSTCVHTIICQEGTEMVGAFMADVLSRPEMMAMNAGMSICVLTPELNTSSQLIFRDNTLPLVQGRSILLLISSISTGKTVERAISCINYYSGHLAGISALFSVAPEISGVPVSTIFTGSDIIGYQTYTPESCEMCAGKQRIDGIISSHGYSKL